jgi:hypothetical protein
MRYRRNLRPYCKEGIKETTENLCRCSVPTEMEGEIDVWENKGTAPPFLSSVLEVVGRPPCPHGVNWASTLIQMVG